MNNGYGEEMKNGIGSEQPDRRRLMKKILLYQAALFLLAFLGGTLGGLLPFIFGIVSSGITVYLLLLRPTPLAFAGGLLGHTVSMIVGFSYNSVMMLIFYLAPVLPLFITVLRCGGKKLSEYRGLFSGEGIEEFASSPASRRTSALMCSLVYFLLFLLMIGADVIAFSGVLTLESIKNYATAVIGSVYDTTVEMYLAAGIAEDAVPKEMIEQAIQLIYLLSVAFGAMICLSCGYGITVVLNRVLKTNGIKRYVFPEGYDLQLSAVSAFVFIGVLLAYTFSSVDGNAAVYVAAYNLKIIFTHIFMVYGFSRLLQRIGKLEERYGSYFRLAAIVVIIMLSGLIYTVLPIYGAYVLLRDKASRLARVSSENEEDDNGGDK